MAIAYDGLELRQRLDRKLVASILELTGIGSKKSQRALFLKWLNNELKVVRGAGWNANGTKKKKSTKN